MELLPAVVVLVEKRDGNYIAFLVGRKLKHHLEIEFEEKKHHDIYWDDVAMFCYPTEYEMGIYPMQQGDIVEIDSLEELVTMDASYQTLLEEAHYE